MRGGRRRRPGGEGEEKGRRRAGEEDKWGKLDRYKDNTLGKLRKFFSKSEKYQYLCTGMASPVAVFCTAKNHTHSQR